jgi:hypothetical protein
MQQAALLAGATGNIFSGCGISINAQGELATTQEGLENSGYGNKTSEEAVYSFDKKMHCVVCQPSPKESDPKKWCGPCGICKSCDTTIKLRNKAWLN